MIEQETCAACDEELEYSGGYFITAPRWLAPVPEVQPLCVTCCDIIEQEIDDVQIKRLLRRGRYRSMGVEKMEKTREEWDAALEAYLLSQSYVDDVDSLCENGMSVEEAVDAAIEAHETLETGLLGD